MNQEDRIAGTVGDQASIHRQSVTKSAVLKRQVPQELERIVAPRTAKSLVNHLRSRPRLRRLLPCSNQRPASPSIRLR